MESAMTLLFIMKRLSFTALLVLIFGGALGAGSMNPGGKEIQLVGKVYVMGNEPLTYVALRLDDGEVYILQGEYDKELRSLQGKRLSVTGIKGEEKIRGAKTLQVINFTVLK
jgi:hypothetical protein